MLKAAVRNLNASTLPNMFGIEWILRLCADIASLESAVSSPPYCDEKMKSKLYRNKASPRSEPGPCGL